MSFEPINESAQHELDVIDAIVRGGGEARPEDAALTDFALLVRNARPVPNHGEVAALDARAQEALSAGKPKQRLVFKPAFAGACALVLVLGAVGVSALNGSEQTDQGLSLSVEESTSGPVQGAGGSTSDFAQSTVAPESTPQAAKVAPRAPGVTSADVPREVARDTRLTLAAGGDKIERISDRVNAIVDEHGGYVASSKVSGGEGNRGRATFDLMIPAAEYKETLAELSKLAHVRSRSQQSEDITTTVNTNERSVKHWTTRVNRLESQLATADSAGQRASLTRQLDRANFAKRQATRRVRADRARVNYVPIALTIVADKSAASKDQGTIAKAVDRAGDILTAIAAVLIVALAVLLPVALFVAAIWLGTRRWNRARSERTIEAAAATQVK